MLRHFLATIIKNLIQYQAASAPVAAVPSLSPPRLLASLGHLAALPPRLCLSLPPQRHNDPQAVNLNEAESRAGLGRTRPYGSVSDRGMGGGETEEWGKDEGVGQGKGEEEGKAYLAEQKKNKGRVTDRNRGYGGKQVAEGGKK